MKYKNPLAEHKTKIQKCRAFISDRNSGKKAYKSDNTVVPLKEVNVNDVEFIAGFWRVQDYFDYNIQQVRDRKIILGQRLEYKENTFFEYYQATTLAYNCYGPIFLGFDMVAAKYTTDKGVYWSYGKSIAEARAFMGIKLYDEYMDLIHSVACKNIRKNEKNK